MTTDSTSAAAAPGSPVDDALKKLLAQSVGKAAGDPVWQALKQSLIDSLPDDGGPINNPGGPQENADSKITWAQYFFFNESHSTALSASVGGYTGLTAVDLAAYANAVLCQSIFYYGTNFTARIDRDRVNTDVATYGAKMIGGVGLLGVTAVSEDPQVMALAAAARGLGATVEQFVQAIIAIVPSRILLYQDKHWVNGDLEIFDWLGQYVAIGGQLTDVGALLTRLYQVNLPEFPNLTAAAINQYRGFLEQNSGPSYTDFSACTDAITYSPNICVQGSGCAVFDDWVSGLYLQFGPGQKYWVADASCCSEDTEILLADGRSKLISQLALDDVIQGADGPVSPLYVSATPLNGRGLYEFFEPGQGPRLTRTHPIVNARADGDGDGASGAPRALAVNASVLRHMLPNHHRTGVGSLDRAVVHTRTQSGGADAGASTEVVRGIRATSTSSHGPAVYDLVLPFSGAGRAGYWAGRNGKFMLVEPELIRLADDPLVGVAIFELIAGLATRGAPGLHDDGHDPLQTELRELLDVYGNQIYPQVFRAALCGASPSGAPGYALDGAGFAIDAFVREVGTHDPASLAALGVLLETCSRHLYTPLSNVIRTAWREIPTALLKASMTGTAADASAPSMLSLTMFDLELLAAPEMFGQAPWTLGVSIGRSRDSADGDVRHEIAADSAGQSSRFRQVFDRMLTHELVSPNERPHLTLDVTAAGQPTPFAVSARVPVPTQTYGSSSVLLCETSGMDIARVNYDVRRMAAPRDVEVEAGRRWDEAHRFAYAVSLGRAMVEPMAAALARRTQILAARPTYVVIDGPITSAPAPTSGA